MMRWVLGLCVLATAACAPADQRQAAQAYWQKCQEIGEPGARARACNDVIADTQAPIERRAIALINRGVIRASEGQHARAIADFGRALRLNPNNAHALLERGAVHQERGAFDAAVADFDAALLLDPTLNQAVERREQARWGRSDRFLDELGGLSAQLVDDPDNVDLLNSRCWLRATHGEELDLALVDCDRALALAPQSANIYDSRALVHLKLGDFERALSDYDRALAIEPDNAHYRYGRGLVLLRLDREGEAEADLERAARQDRRVAAQYRSYGL